MEQQNPPQVVTPAQDEVGLGVECGAHLAQAAVTAGTLEAVLMPVLVQRLQQVPVLDLAVAACTALLLPFRLDGEHGHTCNGKTDRQGSDLELWQTLLQGTGVRLSLYCFF